MVTEQRTAGPFAIGGQSFRVNLAVHRMAGDDSGEAVASVEIRDAEDAVHFERKLHYKIADGRFREATAVTAAPVRGRKGSGILLAYSLHPSDALEGDSWQVFGLLDGKLRPLSKPVALEGQLQKGPSGQPDAAAWDEALQTDVLNFRVWTGRFFVIVPLALDWEWGDFRPAYFLTKCRWRVEADRRPGEGTAAVKLYPGADTAAGEPQEVVVRPLSKVEFLEAEGGLVWEESEDEIGLGVSERIWLRVRIDGREGWLRDPEELDALGLPEAG